MNRTQLNDRFDKYCEQKDCERICTLENYRDCFIGYLLDNYDLKLKEEPKIDWTKVPVDAKILVREFHNDRWVKRRFAKFENGKVYAFQLGMDSWTTGIKSPISWNFAKLVDEPK